jgi:hypothetical protein
MRNGVTAATYSTQSAIRKVFASAIPAAGWLEAGILRDYQPCLIAGLRGTTGNGNHGSNHGQCVRESMHHGAPKAKGGH